MAEEKKKVATVSPLVKGFAGTLPGLQKCPV
jgi:hypothetical protein